MSVGCGLFPVSIAKLLPRSLGRCAVRCKPWSLPRDRHAHTARSRCAPILRLRALWLLVFAQCRSRLVHHAPLRQSSDYWALPLRKHAPYFSQAIPETSAHTGYRVACGLQGFSPLGEKGVAPWSLLSFLRHRKKAAASLSPTPSVPGFLPLSNQYVISLFMAYNSSKSLFATFVSSSPSL